MALQLALAGPMLAAKGYADSEVGKVCARARELCRLVGETHQLFTTLFLLNNFHGLRAEYQTAFELAEQMFSMAEHSKDPLFIAIAHLAKGWVLYNVGEFAQALSHLEHMIGFYDPEQHGSGS